MKDLEEKFRNVMLDYGAILSEWKIKIVEIKGESYSDYKIVIIEVTKKRCRKPFMVYELYTDITRGNVYFKHEKSRWYNL